MELSIPDMTCGHCRVSVTEALHAMDPAARVAVDLSTHRVTLETSAEPQAVLLTLKDIGFEATIV